MPIIVRPECNARLCRVVRATASTGVRGAWSVDGPDYRSASLDVFLDPRLPGRGRASDAIRTLVEHLTVRHGNHRLIIDPAADNYTAIPLLYRGRIPAGGRDAPLRTRRRRHLARRIADGVRHRRLTGDRVSNARLLRLGWTSAARAEVSVGLSCYIPAQVLDRKAVIPPRRFRWARGRAA